MYDFSFQGITIQFSEEIYNYAELVGIMRQHDHILDEFQTYYKELGNGMLDFTMESALEEFPNKIEKDLAPVEEDCCRRLQEAGFSISLCDFSDRYASPRWDMSAYNQVIEHYNELVKQHNKDANRNGMIDAFFNEGKTSLSSKLLTKNVNSIYYKEETPVLLAQCYSDNIRDIVLAYGQAWNELSGKTRYALTLPYEQARKLYLQLTNLSAVQQKTAEGKFLMSRILSLDPLNKEYQRFVLLQYGDHKKELDTLLVHFHEMDGAQSMKMGLLAAYLEEHDPDGENIPKLKKDIEVKYIMRLGIESERAGPALRMLEIFWAAHRLTELSGHGVLCRLNGAEPAAQEEGIPEELAAMVEGLRQAAPTKIYKYRVQALDLAEQFQVLWEENARTVFGIVYPIAQEAGLAQSRIRGYEERFQKVDFADREEIYGWNTALEQAGRDGTLLPEECARFQSMTEKATGLYGRINAFLMQLSSFQYTYRHELIRYLCLGRLLERECRLLGVCHEELGLRLQKMNTAACTFHYGKYDDIHVADEEYYRDVRHASAYYNLLQRQKEQTGFFGKIKNAVLDLSAKKYEDTYNKLTERGRYGIFPVVEGEGNLTKSYWEDMRLQSTKLEEGYYAEYDNPAVVQSRKLKEIVRKAGDLSQPSVRKKLCKRTANLIRGLEDTDSGTVN